MQTDQEKQGGSANEKADSIGSNTYNLQTWNTQNGDGFTFPELEGNTPYLTKGSARAQSGICFSGGGTVSISLVAGFLDGLNSLGLIPNIGYISGVSGGTWGTAPYMYNSEEDPDALLGTHYPPNLIPDSVLTQTDDKTLAKAATNAPIIDRSLAYATYWKTFGGFPLDDVYSMAVGSMFLRPFDIDSPSFDPSDPGNFVWRRKFFTTTEEQASNICSNNSGMTTDAFMTLNQGRPYYIMNAVLLADPQVEGSLENVYPFEFTPLYSGRLTDSQTGTVSSGQKIGGSYVETFGFNSEALSGPTDSQAKASNAYRFELCEPVGTSGSALGKMAQSGDARLLDAFFPNFQYWNPADTGNLTKDGHFVSNNYNFADGGTIENLGITPLLARGLKNIAAFVSEMAFYIPTNGGSYNIQLNSTWAQKAFGYNQLAALFGAQLIDVDSMKKAIKNTKPAPTNMDVIWMTDTVNRQVFDTSEETGISFDAVIAQLAAVDAGPTSVDLTLNVIDNVLFGIQAYQNVSVKLTIVGSSGNWISQLPTDINNAITQGQYNLGGFPDVLVFDENAHKMIALNAAQANLLGNLAYWYVTDPDQTAKYQALFPG